MREECNAVFLFVAELMGSFVPGSGTEDDKVSCGQSNYINNELHKLDLTCEHDRKDCHENIWLQRLYDEMDEYFDIPKNNNLARCLAIETGMYRGHTYKWSVPIELDASALK